MMADNLLFCPSLPDAFAQVGLTYPDRAPEPGKLSRFSTNNKRADKAGWCKLFPDGAGASFGCNRDDSKFTWQQRDTNAPPPSNAECQAVKAKTEQMRKQAAADLATQYARATATATSSLAETCELSPAHAYVRSHRITPYLARQGKDGSIVLPVHGADGAIQSLQFIGGDGGKKFLYHAKMKGGRLLIGEAENGTPIFICEGWATACSIHEATGSTLAVCYSGSNMAHIAADLRRQFSGSPLLVAADLDAHGKGQEYAQAAAAAGAPASVLLPVFADGRDHGDFNDLHQAEGLDVVRLQISAGPDPLSRAVTPFMEPNLPKCDARDGTRDTRPLTELGNAQRLFDVNGDRLKFAFDTQSWLIWNGSSWQWDTAGAGVRSMAAALPSAIYAEGAAHLNDAEHFARHARKSQEQRTINAAVSMLSDFAPVRLPMSSIDADQFTVGVNQATQVIDLRNGAIRAATPSDYITKTLEPTASETPLWPCAGGNFLTKCLPVMLNLSTGCNASVATC